MSNDMLCIDRLTKTYPGGKRAVDALSLRVRPGEIYGFIGHNGAIVKYKYRKEGYMPSFFISDFY